MAARLSSTLLRTQSDRRLVALAAQGSEQAFEALVERYRRPLQSYCRRLLLPAEAAEDVVQQAFLSTWQALASGTDVHDARAWLYRVTHNGAVNALQRSGYDHDQLDDALRGAEAPEDDLERRIAVRRTLAGLAALPELQREALLRTAVEGESHEAVARALGLTDGAVRGLVYRARTTLRTAATALTPGPVIQWAATTGSANAPLGERIGELVAGGGSIGATALLVKGGATMLTAGALVGGVAVVDKHDPASGRDRGAPSAQAAGQRPVAAADRDTAGQDGDEDTIFHSAAKGLDARRGRADERRRSGSPGARDEDEDEDDDDRSGSSGPGSDGDDDDSGSRSSGKGSDGDDDDRSGSGSGSSGKGSDDDDDRSGSGSGSSGGGSGSDDDDRSGSGSGSDDDPSGDDNSGSGSSGSGGDDPDEPAEPGDSSGSGSSGLGTSGSGKSGSGDDDLPEVDEPDDDDLAPRTTEVPPPDPPESD